MKKHRKRAVVNGSEDSLVVNCDVNEFMRSTEREKFSLPSPLPELPKSMELVVGAGKLLQSEGKGINKNNKEISIIDRKLKSINTNLIKVK